MSLIDICNNYYDNNIDNNNVCLICYETQEMCSEPIFSINKFVYKICDCDYNIHKECLNSWININSKCLICHQFVTKKSCKNAIDFYICKNKYVLCITNFLNRCPRINCFLLSMFCGIILFFKLVNIYYHSNYHYKESNNSYYSYYYN